MKHRSTICCLVVLIGGLFVAPGLQPKAEAIVCNVDSAGAWLNASGRLVIRVWVDGGFRVWNLCDTEVEGGRIPPGVCLSYLNMTLLAGSTDVPLQLGFDDTVLAGQVTNGWNGTCKGISNWTVLTPALSAFEIHQ